ncbi:MAG TPA: cytochrome c [Acetobacteraceae bacterium]|nr:cytochrome c [Acetobacteraceae bacterium]
MRFGAPKFIAIAAVLIVMLHATTTKAQGNAVAGRQKVLQFHCQTCHGLDGIAKLPEAPNLAGQNPDYLVQALQEFRSGARQNDMMSLMASKLSDADIDDLATYYASIRITVEPQK